MCPDKRDLDRVGVRHMGYSAGTQPFSQPSWIGSCSIVEQICDIAFALRPWMCNDYFWFASAFAGDGRGGGGGG